MVSSTLPIYTPAIDFTTTVVISLTDNWATLVRFPKLLNIALTFTCPLSIEGDWSSIRGAYNSPQKQHWPYNICLHNKARINIYIFDTQMVYMVTLHGRHWVFHMSVVIVVLYGMPWEHPFSFLKALTKAKLIAPWCLNLELCALVLLMEWK